MQEIRELPLEQLCGQLLVCGFDGLELPNWLRTDLSEGRTGGVVFFSRNIESAQQVGAVCREVSSLMPKRLPVWLGIDQEGGRVRRFKKELLHLPPMRSLGDANDLQLTQESAELLASQLSAIGFNLNFAPVVDVDSNPKNPIIGDRAFGSSPICVTAQGRAVLKGFERQGLCGCLKHFPGHGDTDLDSHLALPTVARDVISLRQTELYPFERLAPEAAAVMSAHVVFSSVDDMPATFSPRLLTTLLKREFGFQGVVFSDDLEMQAVADHFEIEESSVLAIEAGCDALLICSRHDWVLRARAALAHRCSEDPSFLARCRDAAQRGLVQRRRFRARPQAWSQVRRLLWPSASRDLQRRLDAL